MPEFLWELPAAACRRAHSRGPSTHPSHRSSLGFRSGWAKRGSRETRDGEGRMCSARWVCQDVRFPIVSRADFYWPLRAVSLILRMVLPGAAPADTSG